MCPTKAIVWKGTKFLPDSIKENKTARSITRSISCLLLIGLLVGAIVYYWNDESNTTTGSDVEQREQGNEVGDLCYGAELPIVTGSGVTDETINPIKTGKITIINFWGTWCTPCVNELPYFDQIATNYEDTVSVIAIHTNMVSNTEPEYLENYYSESKIIFAHDLEEEGYYSLLGGRGTYPYTVILDEDGVVIKVFLEALHYEDLQEVVESQLNK